MFIIPHVKTNYALVLCFCFPYLPSCKQCSYSSDAGSNGTRLGRLSCVLICKTPTSRKAVSHSYSEPIIFLSCSVLCKSFIVRICIHMCSTTATLQRVPNKRIKNFYHSFHVAQSVFKVHKKLSDESRIEAELKNVSN